MNKYFILLVLVLVSACTITTPIDSSDDLKLHLATQDTLNQPSSEFVVGEDIKFFARLVNNTGDTLKCDIPDTRPALAFQLWKQEELIGSSLDGLLFAQVLMVFTLLPNSEQTFMYRWLSTTEHDPLPTGEYHLTIEWQGTCNLTPVPRDTVDFRVVE